MPATTVEPALVVIVGGVCAALHVGKLAPAIAMLQATLGVTLLQAGFLLSAVQLAGMWLGLAFGMLADGLGGRRSMALGLALLAAASAGGALAGSVGTLMALRVAEGFGFLLVVLPAPGLVADVGARPGTGRIALAETVWSGHEYARLALGDVDAILAWRTMPWDHAPGVAIVRELGGVARRLDGSDYRADGVARGLLVAADDAIAGRVAALLDLASLAPASTDAVTPGPGRP